MQETGVLLVLTKFESSAMDLLTHRYRCLIIVVVVVLVVVLAVAVVII